MGLEADGEDHLDRSCEKWVKEERNILHTIKRRKANWTGHILRMNCLLKHIIQGKIEGGIRVRGRQKRRSKQLLVADVSRQYWMGTVVYFRCYIGRGVKLTNRLHPVLALRTTFVLPLYAFTVWTETALYLFTFHLSRQSSDLISYPWRSDHLFVSKVKVKVKVFRYKPGMALGVPGG
jgi:hypothetical protein